MEIKKTKQETIKSINKALDLLEFLSSGNQEVGIAEISKKLKMGLSTVHRILSTLKSRNYVVQNQKTSKYRLGIKLFELGCEVQNAKSLLKIIRPYLKRLSKVTNETANLAILEDKEVIYLDTIESSEILRTEIIPGTRTPAHCTALGKSLLANLSDNEFEQLYGNDLNLITLTTNSISTLNELKNELHKVKNQGYALDKEESAKGINCVGAPIFNNSGEVIAAISITGPASRFIIERMMDAKEQLLLVTKDLSKLLYQN